MPFSTIFYQAVFAWSDDWERFKRVKNDVGSQLALMEAKPRHNTVETPTFFWAAIPGNAGDFPAEGGYYLKFLSDPTRTFFLSIGGSALAGYETVNWGDRLLHDGSTLLAKDAFIYGGAITLELDSYITDRIVLLAGVRERLLWGGSLGKFSTQFGLGIKFIIN